MKRLILKPVLIPVVFLAIFSTNLQSQDLNSATLLTRSEQYDKAGEMLQQLIQKEPGNSKNYFYLGENYLLDYFSDTISNSLAVATKAAQEVYQKGVDANPNDPLNYVGLAKVAFYNGDEKTAADMRAKARSLLLPYKNIKKISPPAKDYAFALAKIAESYIKADKVDTSFALPLIREAIKIDNKGRDVYLIAGDLYMLVNDGSKAIMNYNQAQFADPQSPTANMKIGFVYVKGRALQAAIPFFEQAIELNANYAPAYRELGQLYAQAGRFDQSKQYFQKYLDLTAGNIPAKIRYVTSLFYSKEYEEVIKNVEEIFKVDQSRTYMNRIAGYSSYEKNPPDYNQALAYMEKLFQTVAQERIIQKDYLYLARILLKKNENYVKMITDQHSQDLQLEKIKAKYATAPKADKAKLQPGIDEITGKIQTIQNEIAAADKEIDRAFVAYDKALSYKPEDKNLINEIANSYAIYRRYEGAAKTWAKLLDPSKDNTEELMRIGRAYYNGDNLKAADSVFTSLATKNPNFVPAHLWIARTYSKMDPDTKQGLAKPKFEKLIEVVMADPKKYGSEMIEAFNYLSYFHMMKEDFDGAKDYYNRMINLDPNNKDYKIRGYQGLGSVELRSLINVKTNEGRLPYLSRAGESFNKILEIDPANAAAKSQLNYIREFQAQIKKGINPNEIRGVVTNPSGQPLPYVSIRVKDTAAENLTNAKGEYKFEIPQGSETLIVSLKGYKTVEIPITQSRIYNVTLEQ